MNGEYFEIDFKEISESHNYGMGPVSYDNNNLRIF